VKSLIRECIEIPGAISPPYGSSTRPGTRRVGNSLPPKRGHGKEEKPKLWGNKINKVPCRAKKPWDRKRG